jgi:hypothetical protein
MLSNKQDHGHSFEFELFVELEGRRAIGHGLDDLLQKRYSILGRYRLATTNLPDCEQARNFELTLVALSQRLAHIRQNVEHQSVRSVSPQHVHQECTKEFPVWVVSTSFNHLERELSIPGERLSVVVT